MPRPKRALSGVDPNIPTPESSRGKKQATGTKATTETSSSTSAASNDINAAAPSFISIPRPNWDISAEAYDKEGNESGSSDAEDEDNNDKSVTDLDSPDWPWVMSSPALDMYYELEKQAEKRDQDLQDVYIYNDFTAYGINEVIDNWLKDFNKEVSRRAMSPYAVWARLEAFSLFAQLDYIHYWFHGDDCHGFAETIALIGKAVLTGVGILKKNQLFKPYNSETDSSGIRNIPVVLALFCQFARSWTKIGGDHYGETKWVPKVGKVARQNDIEIKGPYNFHEVAEKMFESESQDEEDKGKPRQKKKVIRWSGGNWGTPEIVEIYSDEDEMAIRDSGDYTIKGWKAAFKDYSRKHGKGRNNIIGGSSYDITRFSQAEKKKYSLDEGNSE